MVDRLRVVSEENINLRINVDNGFTFTDTELAFAGGDVNAGKNPYVTNAAYENPDNDPLTGTTLRVIDTQLDVLITQNPANNGTLLTQGPLGINVGDLAGFDIAQGTAYLASTDGANSTLYSVNLTTGAATSLGQVGSFLKLEGLTALQTSQRVFAITTTNSLISFNSDRPDVIMSRVAVTGLQTGETIAGIDFRPATGELYAVGQSASVTNLYTINVNTGTATLVTALTADPADVTAPFTALVGTITGVDFNPAVDRLRIVTEADQNLRVNPTNGLTFTDTDLAFNTGDPNQGGNPFVVASAYSGNSPARLLRHSMGLILILISW